MIRHTKTALIIEIDTVEPHETQELLMDALTLAISDMVSAEESSGEMRNRMLNNVDGLLLLLKSMFPDWQELKKLYQPNGKAAA